MERRRAGTKGVGRGRSVVQRGVSAKSRRHVVTDSEIECFAGQARQWGLKPSISQLRSMQAYVSELLRWNERFNLTGAKGAGEILVWHVLDSLAAIAHLQGTKDLVDVGSGAGLPGIPIKIFMPSLRVVLLEARRKRVAFLEHVVDELGLEEAGVVWGRIEEGRTRDQLAYEGLDAIVARASVRDERLLTLGRELMRPGGRLLLMKGSLGTREVESLREQALAHGWGRVSVAPYRLPGARRMRHVVRVDDGWRLDALRFT